MTLTGWAVLSGVVTPDEFYTGPNESDGEDENLPCELDKVK